MPHNKISNHEKGNWKVWKKFDLWAAVEREMQRVYNEEPKMIFD